MIINRVPLLKPKIKLKDYYELWWGYPDESGVVAGGSLEQMSEELEYYIDRYADEYYCSDWEPGKRARLIHRDDNRLQWLFEIKEAE